MSLTAKQRRFAEEYSVDHNATRAAVRAGYSERTAKQQGHRLLQNPAVRHAVGKLDAVKTDELGLEAKQVLAEILDIYREASRLQPKVWKGEAVTYTDADGVERQLVEFVSPTVAVRMLELLFRKAGFDVSRAEIEEKQEVVFQLVVDRELKGNP